MPARDEKLTPQSLSTQELVSIRKSDNAAAAGSTTTTSAYSKARIGRSHSSAKQDIETWATGGMKGHVHLLRNSGFLVSNVVEDRALECKLWDLSRERNAYLRFQEREKTLFLERLKVRNGGIMRELVSYLELGKTPRRRITPRFDSRPITRAESSPLRSSTATPSVRPNTSTPAPRAVRAGTALQGQGTQESDTSPSTSSALRPSSSTSSSPTQSEDGDAAESEEASLKNSGLRKSEQPLSTSRQADQKASCSPMRSGLSKSAQLRTRTCEVHVDQKASSPPVRSGLSKSVQSRTGAHEVHVDQKASSPPVRSSLSKSAQPRTRAHNIHVEHETSSAPIRSGLSKSAQPMMRRHQMEANQSKHEFRNIQLAPSSAMSMVRPCTAAPDFSNIPHGLLLKYPGRRFIPVQLANRGFHIVQAPPATQIYCNGTTLGMQSSSSSSSSSIATTTLNTTGAKVSDDSGIDKVLSRSLCFSEEDKVARTHEFEEVERLIDGVDSLRGSSTRLRRNRLRSATAELVLRELFSNRQ